MCRSESGFFNRDSAIPRCARRRYGLGFHDAGVLGHRPCIKQCVTRLALLGTETQLSHLCGADQNARMNTRIELRASDGRFLPRCPSRFCNPRFQMRRLVAMPKIVESEVSTRRQNASGIVSKDDARSIAHAEVFESRLQIRDQWKFIQRILAPFNQIVEPDKTRSRSESNWLRSRPTHRTIRSRSFRCWSSHAVETSISGVRSPSLALVRKPAETPCSESPQQSREVRRSWLSHP
jgi:hypothetical protein